MNTQRTRPALAPMSARQRRRLQRRRRRDLRARRPVAVRFAALLAGVVAVAGVAVSVGVGVGAVTTPTMLSRDVVTAASPASTDPVVRILDGSGRAGIQDEVADLLRPAGFRVTIGGAVGGDDEITRTRILVHDAEPATLATAADLKDLLGFGVIEKVISAPPGVDVTLVVGQDFPTP